MCRFMVPLIATAWVSLLSLMLRVRAIKCMLKALHHASLIRSP